MATRIVTYDSIGKPVISLHTMSIPVYTHVNTEEGIAVLYMLKCNDKNESPTWISDIDIKPDTELEIDHNEVVLWVRNEKVAYLKKDEVETLIASLTELLEEL